MKSTVTRVLALVIMASSINLFAAADSKHRDANASAAKQQQEGSAAQEATKQKKEKKSGERSEQEQEFDRVLMAIYG
jgi:ribosomal protein L12E/L44/L45/RPP1/RPP2